MIYILAVSFAGLALLGWGHPVQGHLFVGAIILYCTDRVLERMEGD